MCIFHDFFVSLVFLLNLINLILIKMIFQKCYFSSSYNLPSQSAIQNLSISTYKRWHFWITYLPCLVNVVCERPRREYFRVGRLGKSENIWLNMWMRQLSSYIVINFFGPFRVFILKSWSLIISSNCFLPYFQKSAVT